MIASFKQVNRQKQQNQIQEAVNTYNQNIYIYFLNKNNGEIKIASETK